MGLPRPMEHVPLSFDEVRHPTPVEAERLTMGIYIDYTLRAEGSEESVRGRLEAVRRRCLDLPLKAVGDVLRVEPVYNGITIMLYESEGLTLPEAIAERVRRADADRDH